MKTERRAPSFLWIILILMVPFLYGVVWLVLFTFAAFGIAHVAPGLSGSGMWSSEFAKTVIALFAFWLIYRYKLQRVAGLSARDKWDHRLLFLIPVYLPLLNFYGTGFHVPADSALVLTALAYCFLTGFSEEVFFRGFLQSVFIKLLWTKRRGIALAVLLSSTTFGMMHLVNCFAIHTGLGFNVKFEASAQATVSALVQVVYATFFGIFFGAVLLKTNKLWPLVLMHALVNFPASLKKMTQLAANQAEDLGIVADQAAAEGVVINLGEVLWTAPLLLVGLLVIRTIKPADLVWKLDGPVGGAPSPTA